MNKIDLKVGDSFIWNSDEETPDYFIKGKSYTIVSVEEGYPQFICEKGSKCSFGAISTDWDNIIVQPQITFNNYTE